MVSFDNHPDWDIRPPKWCCGSWVNRALELPHVERVSVWGCGNFECWWPHQIFGNRRAERVGKLEVHPWADDRPIKDRQRRGAILREDWRRKFENFAANLDGTDLYITIDLDCVRPEETVTNWESGRFDIVDLVWALKKLRERSRVIAGSPGDLPDGRPRFTAPQPGHREYLDALRQFQPRLANIDDANSPATVAMYMSTVYAMTALQGAADSYGELSQDALYRWIGEKGFNVDVKIGPPIIGYKKGCKLGNEATWYGTWKWDAARQKVINNGPVTPQQIGPKFWTKDPCFLTGIADELVLGKTYGGLHSQAVVPWRPGRSARLGPSASML